MDETDNTIDEDESDKSKVIEKHENKIDNAESIRRRLHQKKNAVR